MDLHMFFIPLAERGSLNNHHHPTETILALCESTVYNRFYSLYEKIDRLECIVCNKLFLDGFFDETPNFEKLESICNLFWYFAKRRMNIALFADEALLSMAEEQFRMDWLPDVKKELGIGYKFFGHLSLPLITANPVRMMISKINSRARIDPFFSEQDYSKFTARPVQRDELRGLADRAMYFRQ
jgi:hypothetical protein